jgi:predicted TIM-barrel fold metal-dependent hydrolase
VLLILLNVANTRKFLPRSYSQRGSRLLDSPKEEWLWEIAEANDIAVHIHPPMQSIGHESLMQYRLNEAVGRPFDSTVNGARMIASGVFDRHPKLQVLIVHMGGGLAPIVGRLEFASTTAASRTRRRASLARISGRPSTISRPTFWSTPWVQRNWSTCRD